MIARGFKPVGWVAAVGGAALGCYMLSLNVAAERAELAKIERQIVMAKQDIRSLQTELGTRGRLQQLEHWNAEVLALSAPVAGQFLENELTLARFETREPTIEERAKVQLASAETPAPKPAPVLAPADYAAAAARAAKEPKPLVHRASFVAPMQQPKTAISLLKAQTRPFAQAKLAAPEPKAARIKADIVKTEKAVAPTVKLAEAKKIVPAKTTPKPAVPSSTGILDDSLLKELGEAARSEKAGAGAGAR